MINKQFYITKIFPSFENQLKSGLSVHINSRVYSAFVYKYRGKTIYKADGKEYLSDENKIVFLPENKTYDFKTYGESKCIQINFRLNEPLSDKIISFDVENKVEIKTLFKKIITLYSRNEFNNCEIMSELYKILKMAVDYLNLNSVSKQNLLAQNAIKIVENNLSNTLLDNFFIANKLNISEIYLRKVFKNVLGTTPSNYIRECRIKKAIFLLSLDLSITEISEKVGYSDVYAFSKAFKKSIGLSPRTYKNENLGIFY